jgi:hypothetical protein
MAKVLLREWAEARLEPGDLDHEGYRDTVRRLAYRVGDPYPPPEVWAALARIEGLYPEVERLCRAERLWGWDDGKHEVPIRLPPGVVFGWHVDIIFRMSMLRYRSTTYIAVQTDEAGPPRSVGQPRRFERKQVFAAYDAAVAAGDIIPGETSWPQCRDLVCLRLKTPIETFYTAEYLRQIITQRK